MFVIYSSSTNILNKLLRSFKYVTTDEDGGKPVEEVELVDHPLNIVRVDVEDEEHLMQASSQSVTIMIVIIIIIIIATIIIIIKIIKKFAPADTWPPQSAHNHGAVSKLFYLGGEMLDH